MTTERGPRLGNLLVSGLKLGGMVVGGALAYRGFNDIIPEATELSSKDVVSAAKAVGGVMLIGTLYASKWRV